MTEGRDNAAIESTVVAHYGAAGLEERILAALEAQGIDPSALRPEHLAPFEELHIGGRQATIELMSQLPVAPGMRILDIGSGIGGASRYLAAHVGCHVTGIDVTPSFVEVATSLSRRVGLADKVEYHHSSALSLPFGDGSFDGAYTLHVAMNIADKVRLYAEAQRVLKPGAALAIYDVLRGPAALSPHYPLPWASDLSSSFLVDRNQLGTLLDGAGFEIEASRDRRAFALDYFEQLRAKAASQGASPPPAPAMLAAPDLAARMANLVRSLEDERVVPWELVCRRR